MRAADWAWFGAVTALSAAGLALKLGPGDHFVFADSRSAGRDLDRLLIARGFTLLPPRFAGDWRRLAYRGDCTLMAGIAGDMGQHLPLWQRAASEGGTLRFHFRGRVSSRFPRWRAPIEDQVQRQLARLGIPIWRPAVVATIARGSCSDLLPPLANIEMPVEWQKNPYGAP